ncbi:MAG: Mut7-C RNAse domain-containing protein [Candidatus Binataceae bacterium]
MSHKTLQVVVDPPAFAADRMVGRLARWLRMLGADVLYDPALSGPALLRLARREGRRMLTRDKRLRTAPDVLYVESNLLRDQLREVLASFPFDARRHAFTRCLECNRPLTTVARELVARRVPPFVYASQDQFAECKVCGRIYWPGTHVARVMRELSALGL